MYYLIKLEFSKQLITQCWEYITQQIRDEMDLLFQEQFLVWNFMEHIHYGILYYKRKRIEDQRLQFAVNFFPVLVKKLVSTVAQCFVTLVQVLQGHVQSVSALEFIKNRLILITKKYSVP